MSRQIQAGGAFVQFSVKQGEAFAKGLTDIKSKLSSFGKSMNQIGYAMAGIGGAMTGAFGGLAYVVANLETATRRFDLIFKDSASSVRKELADLSSQTGLGMMTLVQQAATFGAVFADMKEALGQQGFVKVIRKTMEAMVNLAAIGGISIPEASERLKSAFTSTGESVDQFGYNLRKANLEAEAHRLGLKKSILTMSEAEKQMLKLSIFMKTTEVTGVRFVDMVDTINGQLTLMKSNLLELVSRVGQLLPSLIVPVLRAFNKLLIVLRPIGTLLSPLAVILGPLGAAALTAASGFFALGAAVKALQWSGTGYATLLENLKRIPQILSLVKAKLLTIVGLVAAWVVRLPEIISSFRTLPELLKAAAVWSWALAVSGYHWIGTMLGELPKVLKWLQRMIKALRGMIGLETILAALSGPKGWLAIGSALAVGTGIAMYLSRTKDEIEANAQDQKKKRQRESRLFPSFASLHEQNQQDLVRKAMSQGNAKTGTSTLFPGLASLHEQNQRDLNPGMVAATTVARNASAFVPTAVAGGIGGNIGQRFAFSAGADSGTRTATATEGLLSLFNKMNEEDSLKVKMTGD